MRAKAAQRARRMAHLMRDIGVPDVVHRHTEAVCKCSRHSTADLATLQSCGQQIQTQLVSTEAKTQSFQRQARPVDSRKAVASVASKMSAVYADRMVCTECGCQSGCFLRPFPWSLWQLGRL